MAIPAQQTADLDGVHITYREQGHGTPMMFLHGLAGNSRSWVNQFDAFSKNHRVIAWDAPGFGGSDCVGADVDHFTDTLNQLSEYLEIDTMFLIGHSMGGVVAGRFAGTYPERVRSLVMSCSFWGGAKPKGEVLGSGYQARLDSLNSLTAEEYGQKRARAMMAKNAQRDVIDLAADIASETRPDGFEAAARLLQETDNRDLLKTLNIPVTVISGELDPVITEETTETFAGLFPNATRVSIEGAGHGPYLEAPEAYNMALGKAFGLSD